MEDDAFSPDELASRFCARANETAGEFRDPQSVIKGARHMVRCCLFYGSSCTHFLGLNFTNLVVLYVLRDQTFHVSP